MNNILTLGGLGPVDNATRQKLGQILWNWKLCGQCTDKSTCADLTCPWNRADELETFWNLYEGMSNAYSPERLGRRAAIGSHGELLDIIDKARSRHTMPRREVLCEIFERSDEEDDKPPTSYDQNRAFKIATSAALLMDFGVLHDAANLSFGASALVHWRDSVSADDFIAEVFPERATSTDLQAILPGLQVKKLTRHAKLQLKATNDIRSHLLLDKKEKVVWVFHQGTALRQFIAATRDEYTAGGLPRSVMLEVLDTIHIVLFPPDLGSEKLLAYHVLKHGWDKGLLSDMSTPYRNDDDRDISFTYFGRRLEDLHKELLAPTPHGWLQRRLQRRSETYMLMATMYGVVIAVTLGFFSLIAAVFQSWVAWQQWKHPVH
jgi:hypothetical protein